MIASEPMMNSYQMDTIEGTYMYQQQQDFS